MHDIAPGWYRGRRSVGESDETLFEQWRGGDEPSGREVVARYFPQLRRFFANKVADPDDLLQATFLALLKARDQFAGRSSLRTYVFTIARHELLRHLRELARATAFDPETSAIAHITSSAGTKLVRDEEQRRLWAALRELPVDQQTLLELHYWNDLDAIALGEIFDAPAVTIRSRLHRARVALREELERLSGQAPVKSLDDLDTWARTQTGD